MAKDGMPKWLSYVTPILAILGFLTGLISWGISLQTRVAQQEYWNKYFHKLPVAGEE